MFFHLLLLLQIILTVSLRVTLIELVDLDGDRRSISRQPLGSYYSVNVATHPNFTICINVDSPSSTSKVEFLLNSTLIRVERGSPYCINSDDGSGKYYAWPPIGLGVYNLMVIPYDSGNHLGNSASTTIEFRVPVPSTTVQTSDSTVSAPLPLPPTSDIPPPTSDSTEKISTTETVSSISPLPTSSSDVSTTSSSSFEVPITSSDSFEVPTSSKQHTYYIPPVNSSSASSDSSTSNQDTTAFITNDNNGIEDVKSTSKSSMNTTSIIAIIVSVVALIIGIIGISLCIRRKRKQKSKKQPVESGMPRSVTTQSQTQYRSQGRGDYSLPWNEITA